MQDALTNFDEVKRLLGARDPAMFLDYDGCLTPIVARPEDAQLSETARDAVRHLRDAFIPVAIVSGRGRADVEALVDLKGITYAGSHGFDVRLFDGNLVEPRAVKEAESAISSADSSLRQDLGDIPGVIIENKRFSLAVHYRLVDPGKVPGMDAAVERMGERFKELRRINNKMVFELRPAEPWDKGRAVLWLLDERLKLDRERFMPLYIGDDETDRDAFRALKGRGLSFYVGPSSKAGEADFVLQDPDAVVSFLEAVAALRPNGSRATA